MLHQHLKKILTIIFSLGFCNFSFGQANSKNFKHFITSLTLSTEDHEAKSKEILALAAKENGFFYSITEKSIGLKIPNNRIHTFLKQIELLGETVSKSIQSQDLASSRSKQIAIIESRTKMRQDYLNIIASSSNRNELVEAEQASRNIITELEYAKGRLRQINQKIRYGKVELYFKSPNKLTISSSKRSPFPWINTVSVSESLRDFNW